MNYVPSNSKKNVSPPLPCRLVIGSVPRWGADVVSYPVIRTRLFALTGRTLLPREYQRLTVADD